jgi:hypothetical protein
MNFGSINQHKDSVSPEGLDTDSSLAGVNDQLMVRLRQELKSGQHDRRLWIKALAMADGNKNLRNRAAIYFRLRAERLQNEAIPQKARLEPKRLRSYKTPAERQKAKARAIQRQAVAKRARTLRRIRRDLFVLVLTYLIIAVLILIIYRVISEDSANSARILRYLNSRDVLVFLALFPFVSIIWVIISSLMNRDSI